MSDQDRQEQLQRRGVGPKGGRPPKNAPPLPWDEIDRLLVYGELVPSRGGETHTPVFPTFAELSQRFGCSTSTLSTWAKQHRCLARRQEALARQRVITEEKLLTMRAEAYARSVEDEVRTIDGWLQRFEDEVAKGKVRCDTAGDYDRLARLKQFLLGGPDARKEVNATLTLEALQARHAAAMRVQQASAEERGEVLALPARGGTAKPAAKRRRPAEEGADAE